MSRVDTHKMWLSLSLTSRKRHVLDEIWCKLIKILNLSSSCFENSTQLSK